MLLFLTIRTATRQCEGYGHHQYRGRVREVLAVVLATEHRSLSKHHRLQEVQAFVGDVIRNHRAFGHGQVLLLLVLVPENRRKNHTHRR